MKFCSGVLVIFTGMLCLGDDLTEALRNKRYQDAFTQSEILVRSNPRNAAVWTARGYALAGLGRDPESLTSFDTALRLSPDYPAALKGAVEVSYRSHDRRAPILLNQLLRADPANGPAHGMAGVLAFESGDCSAAIQQFERAGAELASNPSAYSLYGACLIAKHRAHEAVAVFAKVFAEDDFGSDQKNRKPDLLYLLASAEAQDGQIENAIHHFRQAIDLTPKVERNYFELAALCIQRDRLALAAEVTDLGLRNVSDAGRLHALRGVIDAQFGRYEEAAAQFETANSLDSKSDFGVAGLGALYLERNQPDSAVAALRDRLRKDPSDATLNYLLAEGLMRQAVTAGSPDCEEAKRALLTSLRSNPDSAKAHALLGKLYVQKKDYKGAIDELRLAEKYDPTNRMALSQLAIALKRLGRGEEAAATLSKLRGIVLAQPSSEVDLSHMRSIQSAGR